MKRKRRTTGCESHSLLEHNILNLFVDNINFCTVLKMSMFVSTDKVPFPLRSTLRVTSEYCVTSR